MDLVNSINEISFFDIQLINIVEFTKLVIRYIINLVVLFIIIKFGYIRQGKKEYFFTYFTINTLIFFVCFLLSNVKLSIGFAFGLFAIFSILRYRTITIPVKEMTFLFSTITIAVINALSTNEVSLIELLFTNIIIVSFILTLSKLCTEDKTLSTIIIYKDFENLKLSNRDKLLKDLREIMDVDILNVKILEINIHKELIKLKVYYNN